MINLYLLIGPTCSGKSHFLRRLPGFDFLYKPDSFQLENGLSRNSTHFYIDDYQPYNKEIVEYIMFLNKLKTITVPVKFQEPKQVKIDDIVIIFSINSDYENEIDPYLLKHSKILRIGDFL
jgi:hypothetical protein